MAKRTSREPLPPDPDSVEKWQSMPQNKPSRDALPPATGGLSLSWRLLIILGIIIAVLVILSLIAGR